MPWTNPQTWLAGALVTATDFNTQIRDNLQHLYSRPKASRSEANPGYNTTATDWTNVSGFFVTLPSSGADILVTLSTCLTFTNGSAYSDRALLRVTCDGSPVGIPARVTRYGSDLNYIMSTLVVYKSAPGAGNRVFRPQWMVGGTAGLQVTMVFIELFAIEV